MVRFFLLEDYSVGGGVAVSRANTNGTTGVIGNGGLGAATNGTNNSSSTGSSPRTQTGYGSNTSTPHSAYNSNGNYSTMSPPQITPSSAALFNAAATSSRKFFLNIFFKPSAVYNFPFKLK